MSKYNQVIETCGKALKKQASSTTGTRKSLDSALEAIQATRAALEVRIGYIV